MELTASPATRAHAARNGIDLEDLSRRTGRSALAREDVDRALAGSAAGPSGDAATAGPGPERYWEVDHSQHGPVRTEPTSRLAQVAAANLSAANTMIPQVTHHDRADLSAVEALRARLKGEAQERGVKLTALAFHVKALARCLRDYPLFNTSLSADGKSLVHKDYVHVGIAVDTPNGLMVPVVRDADRKGLWQIAADIADLASRAQARKIAPTEMGGASMTISNLGGIGGSGFTPIVNPPEVAILGLTRTEQVPVFADGVWTAVPMVPLDLSYDHRVINGADAARFCARYAALIAEPRRIMI